MTDERLSWLQDLIARNKLEEFYLWKVWRKLSEDILREQKECQVCKAAKRYGPAEIAHHINTVRQHPELALSRYAPDGTRNIIAVCQACHNVIHFGARRYTNEERW